MLGPVLLLTLVETSSWTGKKHNNILETWHVFYPQFLGCAICLLIFLCYTYIKRATVFEQGSKKIRAAGFEVVFPHLG